MMLVFVLVRERDKFVYKYIHNVWLVPARGTNTQHLRDGFLRLLMQRMKEQNLTEEEERNVLEGIQDFKKNFVSMKVKKDTEFVFTKTKEGGLKMVYEVRKKVHSIRVKRCTVNIYMYLRIKIGELSTTSGLPKTLL